jgi:hypothetical protein
MMKENTDSLNPSLNVHAIALGDAALTLLAAFFTNPSTLQAFINERLAQLTASAFLDIQRENFLDVSEVLRLWETAADYLDRHGQPRILAREDAFGFDQLSRTAYPSLEPQQVLESLLQGRAVEITATGLRLVSRAKLVQSAPQAAHARAAQVAARLLNVIRNNLDPAGKAPKHFERLVLNHHLPRAQLPALTAYFERHGQHFLEEVDDWMNTLVQPDNPDSLSAGACLFLFTEPTPDQAPATASVSPRTAP